MQHSKKQFKLLHIERQLSGMILYYQFQCWDSFEVFLRKIKCNNSKKRKKTYVFLPMMIIEQRKVNGYRKVFKRFEGGQNVVLRTIYGMVVVMFVAGSSVHATCYWLLLHTTFSIGIGQCWLLLYLEAKLIYVLVSVSSVLSFISVHINIEHLGTMLMLQQVWRIIRQKCRNVVCLLVLLVYSEKQKVVVSGRVK